MMEEKLPEALHIRLKLFMDSTGLNNSQFADKLGVPRPSFSQIITGRNKKVSDIMLTQIHNAFPELNIMWLMFGEGHMLKSDMGNDISIGDNSPQMSDAYSEDDVLGISQFAVENGNDENSKSLSTATNISKNAREIGPNSERGRNEVADIEGLSSLLAAKVSQDLTAKIDKPCRKVVRITVFYDDNSYESFAPLSSPSVQ